MHLSKIFDQIKRLVDSVNECTRSFQMILSSSGANVSVASVSGGTVYVGTDAYSVNGSNYPENFYLKVTKKKPADGAEGDTEYSITPTDSANIESSDDPREESYVIPVLADGYDMRDMPCIPDAKVIPFCYKDKSPSRECPYAYNGANCIYAQRYRKEHGIDNSGFCPVANGAPEGYVTDGETGDTPEDKTCTCYHADLESKLQNLDTIAKACANLLDKMLGSCQAWEVSGDYHIKGDEMHKAGEGPEDCPLC